MKKTSQSNVQPGSGNVFADLGFSNPQHEELKARLTLQIHQLISERELTQQQAGELLGIRQPQVSLLMRNRSGSFSVAKLIEFLTRLDQDVDIRVKPKKSENAKVSLRFAS